MKASLGREKQGWRRGGGYKYRSVWAGQPFYALRSTETDLNTEKPIWRIRS